MYFFKYHWKGDPGESNLAQDYSVAKTLAIGSFRSRDASRTQALGEANHRQYKRTQSEHKRDLRADNGIASSNAWVRLGSPNLKLSNLTHVFTSENYTNDCEECSTGPTEELQIDKDSSALPISPKVINDVLSTISSNPK